MRFLWDRSYLVVTLLFVGSLFFLWTSNERSTKELLSFSARQHSAALSLSLEAFRELYAKEVVSKLQASGISVGHDFQDDDATVPLPANMTILLGEKFGREGGGAFSSLYSPYPFPWRQESGGLRDSFQRDAWQYLSVNPDGEFSRIETLEGEVFLRYARADIMREDCVSCHNTHPQTPKDGWKAGDMRGVLEISQPLAPVFAAGKRVSDQHLAATATSGGLGLMAMALLVLSARRQIRTQRQLQQDLKLRNSELEQFSYRCSHDLKAPLTASKRLSRFIVEDIRGGDLEEAARNTNVIHQQMEKLEHLVTRILDLARADAQPSDAEPIDFEAIIRDAQTKFAHLADGADVDLRIAINLHRTHYGETARYIQIVENLISNGIKYRDAGKPESHISIEIFDRRGKLHLNFADNGMGIPAEHEAKLFQMFQRFHTGVSDGSGIGLAIVKKHVDHMLGTIQCLSSSEGTEFRIVLPVSEPSKKVPSE